MSQDINLLQKEGPERAAIFTTFMNAKGKILFDGIVVKPKLAGQDDPEEIEYWIDIEDSKDKQALLKHLKKYSLRKKVVVNDISEAI